MTDNVRNNGLLNDLSPFIYGTTRLGHDSLSFTERIEFALKAMETGVWFHTSRQYNDALEVLRIAFDQDRSRVPKLIVKIGGDSIAEFRNDIKKNMVPIAIENIEIAQLCFGGALATDFANGGKSLDEFMKIKKEGLVNRYVIEIFPWTSHIALKALKNGHANQVVDGYILYFNPLQRFASNELWDLLVKQNANIIALRTIAGGPVLRLRDVLGAAWKEYLQKRAVEVAPIFEQSGITDWTEFCLRFAFSFPQIRATVGATSNTDNLNDFLKYKENVQPLSAEIIAEITRLQYRWSDELDIKAEPWTM
jgi:hypothetical protein